MHEGADVAEIPQGETLISLRVKPETALPSVFEKEYEL